MDAAYTVAELHEQQWVVNNGLINNNYFSLFNPGVE